MAAWWTKMETMYNDVWEKRDTRSDYFLGMSSPIPSIALCIAYVIAVVWLLPRFMRNRPAYDCRTFMLYYNFAMIALSGYIFVEFALSGWLTGYSYGCQLVDYSNDPKSIRMLNVSWWFYISKFIELVDTVIFILRKKNSQVTFLHVFHHGIMPASWWVGVRFAGGGFGTFHAWLNSFIHFVMYTYYGLAGLGPAYQKYLWWKKYMTRMQIIQFLAVCLHCSQLLFMKDCDYPMVLCYWIALYAFVFALLFAKFYLQAYIKRPSPAASSKSKMAGDRAVNGHKHSNGVKAD